MRIALKEITPKRILDAARRRLFDIPDALTWHYSQDAVRNRSNLQKYHNAHKGERCFIIANGPSLKRMDITTLKNEFTFSMNRAYILYAEWDFVPKYYVCINELVIEQFAKDILQLRMPKFINFSRRHCFKDYPDNDSLLFLRTGLNLSDRFCGDITHTITGGGTVTFACLHLAYYMGFSEVILIGLDHNFAEKGTPNKTEVRHQTEDESHCHSAYFPKGTKWQLPDLYRSEIAYAIARKAFEDDGRSIFDATVGGKCNIFKKINFESLFP